MQNSRFAVSEAILFCNAEIILFLLSILIAAE
jgi:hypothetical protein